MIKYPLVIDLSANLTQCGQGEAQFARHELGGLVGLEEGSG